MAQDVRYPVGKFTPPAEWTPAVGAESRKHLSELPAKLRAAVAGLNDTQLDTPYREGGWTVRQTVHRIADSHMNAYCRARLALTEDQPTIKPYDESLWAELPDARKLSIEPSLEIIEAIHGRLLFLMDTLTPEQWQRGFVHPERGRVMTLREQAALYAWHSRHHVAHITNLRAARGWQ